MTQKKSREAFETLVSSGALISCELNTLCCIIASLSGRCVKQELYDSARSDNYISVSWKDGVSQKYEASISTSDNGKLSIWSLRA